MASAILQRVALYCRVSTHGQDVSMQTRELVEYCQHRGWQIVGRIPGQCVRGQGQKARTGPLDA
jgi:DNA invertase Pin-like site-specific DNA recombinase